MKQTIKLKVVDWFPYERKLDAFFENIFSQNPTQARRRQETIAANTADNVGGGEIMIPIPSRLKPFLRFLKPIYKKAKDY